MPSLFSPSSTEIVRVALPLPVDRLFDYAVSTELAGEAQPGCRVRVTAGGRRLTGVVVQVAAGTDVPGHTLRPLEAVLDPEPVLAPRLLGVLIEEAQEVLCPIGIALATALPPGSAPRAVRGWELTERGRAALASGALMPDAQVLLAALEGGGRSDAQLRRHGTHTREGLAALARDHLVARAHLERGPRVRATHVRSVRLAPGADVEAAYSGPLARAPRQAALLRRVAAEGPCEARDLAAAGTLRALLRRGLVQIDESLSPALVGLPSEERADLVLTAEQQSACRAIGAAVRARQAERFLLHGVTGSGKTEVYLRAVAEALRQGRQALVLVPEITLTHQILGRLRARFGDQLAVLHSGLKPGERLAQWERLRRGQTPIAVGARSALFAPTQDLGLIVMDEEHDGAYKNQEGFRYHARGLALRRARADQCPLVMGSATPSLELRHAAEQGSVRLLRLPHRVGTQPLPSVEVVDLARERAMLPRGRKLILSGPLRRDLRRTLDDGAQAILFLNRRGFSTQIACFSCQHVERCKHCDVALTYHAGVGLLRCHYCDYRVPPPDTCPACGAPDTALLGIGTERLEEEVRSHFPDARLARLDRDTAARRGTTEAILQGLRKRTLDIVVGTQMLAKGHDFPGVRLVGVINADLGLHLPDFRAAERTFQLLTQVAGRAGRGRSPGRVVLQTWSPDHYAIRPVTKHDYEGFYAEEIQHRAALDYPPFGHLAQVRVSAPVEAHARDAAAQLARIARATGLAEPPGEVLGPAPAAIARLRGRYRFHLLLKHRDAVRLREGARALVEAGRRLPSTVRSSVDLNPIDML